MKRHLLTSLFTLASLAIAPAAHASTLFLNSLSPNANMTISFPGISPITTGYVGTINWTFDRNDPDNANLDTLINGNNLTTYCIEGTQDVTIQQTANFSTIISNLNSAPQDNVGSLYQMVANASTLQKFWDAYYAQSTTNSTTAAAFQLGVWEIVYDNNTSLSNGNFTAAPVSNDQTSADAYAQAQAWLDGLANTQTSDHYQLYVLSDPLLQDQLFGVPATGATPGLPLPSAIPMGAALGLGLLSLKRLKRRR